MALASSIRRLAHMKAADGVVPVHIRTSRVVQVYPAATRFEYRNPNPNIPLDDLEATHSALGLGTASGYVNNHLHKVALSRM